MKISITNSEEPILETEKFIDENYCNDYRPDILLSDCQIYQRGKFLIIEHEGKIYYSEHAGIYCYLEDAIHFMNPDKPKKWKTLERLTTFRQAIRENYAQGMGLDDLLHENISFSTFKEFMKVSRVFDKRHHGQETF